MTTSRDPDVLIRAFIEEGMEELPDSSYDMVRSQIDHTRQRVVIGPGRIEQVTRYATYGIAAAAVVLIAVVGVRLLPGNGGLFGPGGSATPAPTVAPTLMPTDAPTATPAATATAEPSASPEQTPIADPNGQLQPGVRYVAHPFDTLLGMDARGFNFEVPSADWEAAADPGRTVGVAWNGGSDDNSGVGLGFLNVHSLNSDACHWTTDDDITIGSTVDDLVEALRSSDQFEWRDPVLPNTVPGETTSLQVIMPAALDEADCDDGEYRIWNAEGFDIYAQGPANVWQLSIFAVDGERYIVMGSSMPDTPEEVASELWSIFRSVTIDSDPGCPQYDHNCN